MRTALPSGRDTYRSLPDVAEEIDALVASNSAIAKRVSIGKSVEGRDLTGIEIGEGVNEPEDGRPVFLMFGAHHAREWPSEPETQASRTLISTRQVTTVITNHTFLEPDPAPGRREAQRHGARRQPGRVRPGRVLHRFDRRRQRHAGARRAGGRAERLQHPVRLATAPRSSRPSTTPSTSAPTR